MGMPWFALRVFYKTLLSTASFIALTFSSYHINKYITNALVHNSNDTLHKIRINASSAPDNLIHVQLQLFTVCANCTIHSSVRHIAIQVLTAHIASRHSVTNFSLCCHVICYHVIIIAISRKIV